MGYIKFYFSMLIWMAIINHNKGPIKYLVELHGY